MPRLNPFTPGRIVTPGMFAGRYEEMIALEGIIFQSERGNPQHFAVTGQRGIGKSSLLLLVQHLASGAMKPATSEPFSSLVARTELEPGTDYYALISKVSGSLAAALAKHERAREAAKAAWEFLRHCEAAGVRIAGSSVTPQQHQLLASLVDLLCEAATRVADRFKSIFVLIDEAEQATDSTNLEPIS